MSDYKQVIVMRTDLNMRKGKMIAQGAHASISFMILPSNLDEQMTEYTEDELEIVEWVRTGMKKICVRCDSEDELVDIEARARAAGLRVHMIIDRGDTEFHGVPTKTCLAIGPNEESVVDEVTGGMKLL